MRTLHVTEDGNAGAGQVQVNILELPVSFRGSLGISIWTLARVTDLRGDLFLVLVWGGGPLQC